MVGTIFTKYWYIIDAVGETLVSVQFQRRPLGAVLAGACSPFPLFSAAPPASSTSGNQP